MRSVPLFTVEELAAAFSLIMPTTEAQGRARQWFDESAADRVDDAGRFLYTDWWEDLPELAASARSEGAPPTRESVSTEHLDAGLAEALKSMSDEERDAFLMRFSDFHLGLASLVSPELATRVQQIRGESDEAADNGRMQMRRIVDALRR